MLELHVRPHAWQTYYVAAVYDDAYEHRHVTNRNTVCTYHPGVCMRVRYSIAHVACIQPWLDQKTVQSYLAALADMPAPPVSGGKGWSSLGCMQAM